MQRAYEEDQRYGNSSTWNYDDARQHQIQRENMKAAEDQLWIAMVGGSAASLALLSKAVVTCIPAGAAPV